MATEKDNGGPAFPGNHPSASDGMSLRDYFAGQLLSAMQIIGGVEASKVARTCYVMADAMIAERASK